MLLDLPSLTYPLVIILKPINKGKFHMSTTLSLYIQVRYYRNEGCVFCSRSALQHFRIFKCALVERPRLKISPVFHVAAEKKIKTMVMGVIVICIVFTNV
jgi:hypothetical protein